MGTWGSGVFESDSASDFLDEAIRKLTHEIVFFLSDETLTGLPSAARDQVAAAADILALWCEHYETFPNVSKKVVRRWREVYLQQFDTDKAWDKEDSDVRTQRRKVIETTFARLEAVATQED